MNAEEIVSTVFGNTDDSARAVDHVFAVLEATYGPSWDRAKGNAPIGSVKTVWAHHLSEFTHSRAAKQSILWALQNPTDAAPNAMQFRNLCRQAPSRTLDALPAPLPKQNPEMAAKIRESLAATPKKTGRLDWSRRILQDVENGIKRTPTVIAMAKAALGITDATHTQVGA
jgi:hypothetical protein